MISVLDDISAGKKKNPLKLSTQEIGIEEKIIHPRKKNQHQTTFFSPTPLNKPHAFKTMCFIIGMQNRACSTTCWAVLKFSMSLPRPFRG